MIAYKILGFFLITSFLFFLRISVIFVKHRPIVKGHIIANDLPAILIICRANVVREYCMLNNKNLGDCTLTLYNVHSACPPFERECLVHFKWICFSLVPWSHFFTYQ
jgi:hypothetical protein